MSEALRRTVTVISSQGLHARPADLLVRLAGQYGARIMIGRGGEEVDCKSILSLLTLGAAEGTELNLTAEGDDAQDALDAIEQFFLRGFDEMESEQPVESHSDSVPACDETPQEVDPA